MPYRDLEPVSKQLTIVIGLTVVGFMAFGLALSFYRNVLFEDTLLKIAEQNQRQREEIEQRQNDLDYYQSSQYKDKYAKENLSKLNPGEKILIVLESPEELHLQSNDGMTATEQQEAVFDEYLRQLPVIEHWKLYLFHKDAIDKLKMSL